MRCPCCQKDFEQLELVCRTTKENDKYFGGMQVITSGDFYQLPPVPNILYNDSGKFCFQSEIWNKVLCHKVNFTKVVRQTEPQLVRAVRETALGAVSQESDEFIRYFQGLFHQKCNQYTFSLGMMMRLSSILTDWEICLEKAQFIEPLRTTDLKSTWRKF